MNNFDSQSINFISVGEPYYGNICKKCNKPFWDTGESTAPISTCECWKKQFEPFQPYQPFQPYTPPYNEPVKMGWKCPCCGGGVAPGVERCPCTPLQTLTWTTYTGSLSQDKETISNKNKKKKK